MFGKGVVELLKFLEYAGANILEIQYFPVTFGEARVIIGFLIGCVKASQRGQLPLILIPPKRSIGKRVIMK